LESLVFAIFSVAEVLSCILTVVALDAGALSRLLVAVLWGLISSAELAGLKIQALTHMLAVVLWDLISQEAAALSPSSEDLTQLVLLEPLETQKLLCISVTFVRVSRALVSSLQPVAPNASVGRFGNLLNPSQLLVRGVYSGLLDSQIGPPK
jgi:hypothetical protein